MDAIVKLIVFGPLFVLPVARFMKQHVDPATEKFRLALRYPETRKVGKNGAPILPSRSTSYATEKYGKTLKRESAGTGT